MQMIRGGRTNKKEKKKERKMDIHYRLTWETFCARKEKK